MKPKSKIMFVQRLLAVLLAVGLTGILLSGCDRQDKDTATGPSSMQIAVQSALASRDSLIQSMVLAFDEVDANLEVIREKEGELRNWADGEEVLGNREERIVRDIQVINTLMENNRQELASLRTRLRKAGVDVTALETRLNHLELANAEKTSQLEDLKNQLASAQITVASLNDTLSEKSLRVALQDQVISSQTSVINAQDEKMHEAFVATGSFKELKARGLVDKKGAILGLGGEKSFTAKTDHEEFATIDLRDQLMIPIQSKKAMLITHHPNGSYRFMKDQEGKVSALEITKPDEFWESSRYLIVATD